LRRRGRINLDEYSFKFLQPIGLVRRHASSAERVMDDEDREQRELQERVMRFRAMEREVTDPLAIGLLHDIVTELEEALEKPDK
jgi:hypothetical protein